MEYVIVRYPASRPVFIDSHEEGMTNATLELGERRHYIFDLGAPFDYEPETIEVEVSGTSYEKPLEIVFRKA